MITLMEAPDDSEVALMECVPQPSVFVAATSTNNSKRSMPDCSCKCFTGLCIYFGLQAASRPLTYNQID